MYIYSFPALEELLRLKLCPLEPIYVANFGEARPEDEKEDGDVDDDHSSLAGKCAAFEGECVRVLFTSGGR